MNPNTPRKKDECDETVTDIVVTVEFIFYAYPQCAKSAIFDSTQFYPIKYK